MKRNIFSDGDFKKSSFSSGKPYRCVKVAMKGESIAVRDSKDPQKNTLMFSADEWDAFVKGVKAGEFDS